MGGMVKNDDSRLLSANEAAAYLDVDPSLVRDLCARGRIKAQKFGINGVRFGQVGVWMIERRELDRYKAKPRRRGGKTIKQLHAR
jgi:excisionase family DNA binding protein